MGGTIHGQIDEENVEVATGTIYFNKIGFQLACMMNFGVQHTFKGSTDGKQQG